MDLNYLMHRQQVERSRAASATSEEARRAHLVLACEYERQIERLSGGRILFPGASADCPPSATSAGPAGATVRRLGL
jgi:hypothetical protein